LADEIAWMFDALEVPEYEPESLILNRPSSEAKKDYDAWRMKTTRRTPEGRVAMNEQNRRYRERLKEDPEKLAEARRKKNERAKKLRAEKAAAGVKRVRVPVNAPNVELRAKVLALRASGLTQRQVGAELGFSQQRVNAILRACR
jgi:hypothetical protein